LRHREKMPTKSLLRVAQFYAVGMMVQLYVPDFVKLSIPETQFPPIPGKGTNILEILLGLVETFKY